MIALFYILVEIVDCGISRGISPRGAAAPSPGRAWRFLRHNKIYNLIYLLVALIIIGIIWFKYKEPFFAGKIGENFVIRKLSALDPNHYEILNDLLLPSLGNTETTQIDHTIVSNFGIFCIETKSYTGWIFGNASQPYWTQVIYHFKKRFYNPLRQNYAHTKAIEALVKPRFPTAPIIGFVAFPSADKIQISGTNSVGYATEIVAKIQSFTRSTLSDAEKNEIIEILLTANIQDKATRKLHNRSARALQARKEFLGSLPKW